MVNKTIHKWLGHLFSKPQKRSKGPIMSQDALIFDALRTPRGKGKAQGSLHEVNTQLHIVCLIT